MIDTLGEAVSTFDRGAKALKAENSELRAENDRLRNDRRVSASAGGLLEDGEILETTMALDVRAPGAARAVVAQCLDERVASSALDDGQLLVSELVSNSLRHSGGPVDDHVVVSVELTRGWFRIGVQDSGSGALIAAQPGDVGAGCGFGLNLVQTLSERWGVEHLAKGGTQVWAQLPRSPIGGGADAGANGSEHIAPRAA